MTRFFRRLHLWLAVPFGLLLSFISFTGALLVMLPSGSPAVSTVFRLHRWLMDMPAQKGDMTFGKLMVGIATLAFLLLLVSGVVIWAKRAHAGVGRSLSLRFGHGTHAAVQSLHVAGGMYVLLFSLLMAVTGLIWSFEWWGRGFYGLFGGADPASIRPVVRGLHTGAIGGTATRVIWCAAALLIASLPLTGYWLWIKRLYRKRMTARK